MRAYMELAMLSDCRFGAGVRPGSFEASVTHRAAAARSCQGCLILPVAWEPSLGDACVKDRLCVCVRRSSRAETEIQGGKEAVRDVRNPFKGVK
ncbi:uncharacterized [Tachysurus ichikawai]